MYGKIEILKEESEKEISKNELQYCYSKRENVEMYLQEFKNEKIVIKIKDTNEIPYEYTKNFTILRKNENYVEPTFDSSRVIGENTKNSTAGYLGPENPSFEWEEVMKLTSTNDDTTCYSVEEETKTLMLEFNIKEKYGNLPKGEYKFHWIPNAGGIFGTIQEIKFKIDENGNLTHEEFKMI